MLDAQISIDIRHFYRIAHFDISEYRCWHTLLKENSRSDCWRRYTTFWTRQPVSLPIPAWRSSDMFTMLNPQYTNVLWLNQWIVYVFLWVLSKFTYWIICISCITLYYTHKMLNQKYKLMSVEKCKMYYFSKTDFVRIVDAAITQKKNQSVKLYIIYVTIFEVDSLPCLIRRT